VLQSLILIHVSLCPKSEIILTIIEPLLQEKFNCFRLFGLVVTPIQFHEVCETTRVMYTRIKLYFILLKCDKIATTSIVNVFQTIKFSHYNVIDSVQGVLN